MKNEFTAIIERDGEWFIAFCPEIPGANGQGRTKDEARESLDVEFDPVKEQLIAIGDAVWVALGKAP